MSPCLKIHSNLYIPSEITDASIYSLFNKSNFSLILRVLFLKAKCNGISEVLYVSKSWRRGNNVCINSEGSKMGREFESYRRRGLSSGWVDASYAMTFPLPFTAWCSSWKLQCFNWLQKLLFQTENGSHKEEVIYKEEKHNAFVVIPYNMMHHFFIFY